MLKNGEHWGKLIVAKGFKKLPKVHNIAQSGHTAPVAKVVLIVISFKSVSNVVEQYPVLGWFQLHLFLLVESEIERKVLMNYTQEREGIDTKKQNSFTIFVPDE